MPRRRMAKIKMSKLCYHHRGVAEIVEVIFEGPDASRYFWRPRWDDIRLLINRAVCTEVRNTNFNSRQFGLFRVILEPLYELARHGEARTKEKRDATS